MKRYYPSKEEQERFEHAQRMLGIPSGSDETPLEQGTAEQGATQPVMSEPGVTRMSIAAWRELWHNDPEQWLREVRHRPRRFDGERWERAVLAWRNEVPRADRDDAPLRGVPFVVKDLFDVTGEETRCASAVLGVGGSTGGPPVLPARDDAWLVSRIRASGGSLQGRTAMNEFAYGIDGRNTVTGDCPHPLDPARISGGSSSGSAWAVAAGVTPLALGSDTGGSIRVPAALCGIYGYRLPWGAHRLSGTFPLSPHMDTVGWFAAGVEDARFMLELVGSTPPEDHGAGPVSIAAVLPPEVSLAPEVRERWDQALEFLADSADLSVEVIDPPAILGSAAWKAYNVIGSSDAAAVHREWLDHYQELYDPTVWSLIDRGRHWSTDRIAAAERTRDEVLAYLERLLATFDVVAMPVTPQASPTSAAADGTFREAVLRLNAPVSLAGLGALTVPLPHDAVRSSGMQLVVPAGGEDRILKVLSRLER